MYGSNPYRINLCRQGWQVGLSASCMFDVGIKESAQVNASPKRNAQKQGWLAMCTAISYEMTHKKL